jgi:hypothetical protein
MSSASLTLPEHPVGDREQGAGGGRHRPRRDRPWLELGVTRRSSPWRTSPPAPDSGTGVTRPRRKPSRQLGQIRLPAELSLRLRVRRAATLRHHRDPRHRRQQAAQPGRDVERRLLSKSPSAIRRDELPGRRRVIVDDVVDARRPRSRAARVPDAASSTWVDDTIPAPLPITGNIRFPQDLGEGLRRARPVQPAIPDDDTSSGASRTARSRNLIAASVSRCS